MKKIYTLFAALGLCAMSASAAVTVTLADGTPVANGETITVGRDKFEHVYIPGILDRWTGEAEIEVKGAAPIAVSLNATSGDFQFCPVGQNCYTLEKGLLGNWIGSGSLTADTNTVPVHLQYDNVGENLPEETQKITCTFTDADGAVTVTLAFDTTEDSGVDAVWAADGTVTAYTIAGVRVLDQAAPEAVKTLPAGLYIVNGKKVAVK